MLGSLQYVCTAMLLASKVSRRWRNSAHGGLISFHSAVNHHHLLFLYRRLRPNQTSSGSKQNPAVVSEKFIKSSPGFQLIACLFCSDESLCKFRTLTIKPAVPLGERGQKELAALLHRLQEVSLALQGQRLFHLTGAAGVVLRTETEVLAYQVTADMDLDQSLF